MNVLGRDFHSNHLLSDTEKSGFDFIDHRRGALPAGLHLRI